MKAILIFFVSTTFAIANCPDIKGKFTCSSKLGETYNLEIQNVDVNGVKTYVGYEDVGQSIQTFIADNKVRNKVLKLDGISNSIFSYQVSCQDGALKIYEVGEYEGSKIELRSAISKKDEKIVLNKSAFVNNERFEEEEVQTCTPRA